MPTIKLCVLTLAFVVLTACGSETSTPSSSSSSNSSSSSSSSNWSSSISSSSSSSSSSGTTYTYQPIQNGCSGWASRYWDCCKPHCGWSGNTSPLEPLGSCSTGNQPIANMNEGSSCGGGNRGDAHMCWEMIPYAVNDNLAFGYAAVPASSPDICGRCYQLDFTGEGEHDANDGGSRALQGKTMIVQATNIGGDVEGGQFDILIPGGGVGLFNACSAQWGVSTQELGHQYGGFLRECKESTNYQATYEENKACLIKKCNDVFRSRGLDTLYEGCMFHAEWMAAADNPKLKYKEVACPAELVAGTGMDRSPLSDISNACGN